MNESRAGSISVQLQETIRTIKRYPDALHEIYLKISNAEARIGTVQQTATNRIEVIRTEMSRALYDHKERTDRLIADLTARVVNLEAGHAHKTASDHSTTEPSSSISAIMMLTFHGRPICRRLLDRSSQDVRPV
eukprot:s6607_g1.t1